MKLLQLVLVCALVQLIVSETRIATLYRFYPIARTFSFSYGTPGLVIDTNDVYNFNSDIDYGNYNAGYLTVGIEGDITGKMVDLGSQTSLSQEYGYSETVGYGQGYASIDFASNTSSQLVIRSAVQNQNQNLTETTQLYQTGSYNEYLYPYVDHIVLVRLSNSNNAEKVVKMLILAVDYDYVTFRYDVLRDTMSSGPGPANGTSKIVSMHSLDDLSRTLSFGYGAAGLCYCEAYYCDFCEQCNCNSDLDFDWYGASAITSGVEGGRIANIVDVGTEGDNYNTYGLNVNYFANIRLSGNSLIVGTNTPFDLRNESGALFSQPSPSYISTPVYLDHIYLVRILDTFDGTFERIVKLKIISVDRDIRIILRYEILRDTEPQQPFFDRTANGTFITTLYASDPETHSFDFGHAASGGIIQDGSVYNRGSDIDFNNYRLGGLTVGIQGGENGIIYDLGTPDTLKTQYSPNLEFLFDGFAALFYNTSNRNTVMLNRSADYPIAESDWLKTNNLTSPGVDIVEGHVYILRIWDSSDANRRAVVKLLVLHYVPDEEITFRWVRLAGNIDPVTPSEASIIGFTFTLLLATFLFV